MCLGTVLLRCLPTLLALLALLVLVADARPFRGQLKAKRQLTPEERSLTNSERLARGLPPRAPNFKRIIPGRAPTPVYAKRGSPSASASPSPSPSASPGPSV